MAANKFATMLHRNTHKITVILVYAVLEWVLIFLLLLNSLFSFLISKFAHYFGLKPPCLWCSRVDHILEPNKTRNSYRDLVCEAHATEISKLGYCPNHRKLAEPQNLCTDCSSTEPKNSEKSIEISRRIAFFTWVSENRLENGEKNSKCSCCDKSLSSKVYPPPFLLFKPSWEALGYTLKGDLTAKAMDEGEFSDTSKSDCFVDHCRNDHDIKQMNEEGDDDDDDDDSFCSKAAAEEDCSRSVSNFLQCCKKNENGGDMNAGPETGEVDSSCKDGDANIIQICCREEDESINIMNLPPRISIYNDIHRLIPIELIDSSTIEGRNDPLNGNLDSEPQKDEQVKLVEEAKFFSAVSEVAKKTRYGGLERMEVGELVNSSILMAQQGGIEEDLVAGTFQQLAVTEAAQTPCTDDNNVQVSMKETGEEDDCRSLVDETKCEIFPGMEVSGHELSNQSEAKDPTSSLSNAQVDEPCMDKKFGTEESWDGSVVSEMEGGDGALTIEKLKSALRAERKALNGLYAELEEERSAATIAANQTMAMITRLQEEKAAMQMEALQYQRMMDEQSEYDQEALQLLNELMMKREKEKQELEKELEIYRKKVFDYEAKEKMMMMMMMRRKDGSARSRNSSACGNAEDMDELSIDLNREGRDEDGSFYEHQEGSDSNTPIDAVLNVEEMGLDPVKHLSTLDESLAEFEEERLSILEELKALEEKLFTLAGDDEEQLFEEHVRPIGNFAEYGNNDDSYGFSSPKENGDSNGEHYPESNIIHSTSKKLLPLFDATGIGNEEGELNEEHIESDPSRMQNSSNSNFELVNKKLGIEEEVDHVYERLQALETDREFLKHCISSLKKGDKGMDLLQEILQHLRDLRTVELRARNICDSPLL